MMELRLKDSVAWSQLEDAIDDFPLATSGLSGHTRRSLGIPWEAPELPKDSLSLGAKYLACILGQVL